MSFPILTLLVLLPVVGSVLTSLISNRHPDLVKVTALLTSAATGGMSIWLLFAFKKGEAGFQFVSEHAWIRAWGISWHLGVDGISLFLVPKFIPKADGSVGERNGIRCGALEHKMGIKANATCVMNMDGAKGWHRFRTIVFPLLAPTTFFLLVVNVVYAAFDTFGTINALTHGGPGKDTAILVYKVYNDGFRGQDLGGSSAQSVILMLIVISLTVIQFRFVEKKVQY